MTLSRAKNLISLVVAISLLMVGWSQNGAAQIIEHGRYQERLLELSEILGALHHMRGSCVSSERQIWRENMMTLIRLEAPSTDRKNAMVAQFNKGYGDARRRYPRCDRDTAREAERLASQGAEISSAISQAVNS